jgi:hypothetical protein
MAIKNYTTTKHPCESIGEIQAALAKGGAKKVMIDYDESGEPKSLAFALETERGFIGFQLPANIEGVCEVFKKQKIRADIEQAKKTAWRNVRDWVLAQMAFIEAGNATLQEAFLPYLTNKEGQTLYQVYVSGRLLLAD